MSTYDRMCTDVLDLPRHSILDDQDDTVFKIRKILQSAQRLNSLAWYLNVCGHFQYRKV